MAQRFTTDEPRQRDGEAPAQPGGSVAALGRVTKYFGGTVAVRDVSLTLHAGRGAGAAGRERRGQEHLREAAGRRPSARCRRGRARRASRPCSPSRLMRSGTASRSCTSIPGLFPDLSVAENIVIGHGPTARLGLLDRARMRERRGPPPGHGRPGLRSGRRRSAGCAAPSSSWSRSPARCRCALGS